MPSVPVAATPVALAAAAAAITTAAAFAGGVALVLCAGALVAWIVWRDATSFIIPDGAVLALALLGCVARVADRGASMDEAIALTVDVALTGGVLWLVREAFYRLRGHDGLGLGDVKLGAAAGCLVGAAGFSIALLAAACAGLAVAAVRGARSGDRIAFGVLLAPAVWVALAAEVATVGL